MGHQLGLCVVTDAAFMVCLFRFISARPDVTSVVDWALTIKCLSIYPLIIDRVARMKLVYAYLFIIDMSMHFRESRAIPVLWHKPDSVRGLYRGLFYNAERHGDRESKECLFSMFSYRSRSPASCLPFPFVYWHLKRWVPIQVRPSTGVYCRGRQTGVHTHPRAVVRLFPASAVNPGVLRE